MLEGMSLSAVLLVFSFIFGQFQSSLAINNPPRDPKYLQRFYVEFKDGNVIYDVNIRNERYANTISLVKQANDKSKFKNGIIYFNNADNNDANITAKTYYAVHDIRFLYSFRNITGPDFACFGWRTAQIGDFTSETKKIMEVSKSNPFQQRLGWIGNVNSPLANMMEFHTRPKLLEYAANYSNYFDFKHFPPHQFLKGHKDYKSFSDLTRTYAYLLDIGGNGYSARLKYLLYSKRPIFYVEKIYVEYFYADLIPYVHYIPVKQDLSDLITQYEWAINHPKITIKIAQAAFDYAIKNLNSEKFVAKVGEVVTYLLEDGH